MEIFALLPPPSRAVGIRSSSSSSQRTNNPLLPDQQQITTEQQQQPSVASLPSPTIPSQPHDNVVVVESPTTPSPAPVASYLVVRGDSATPSQQQQQQQQPPHYQFLPLSFHPLSVTSTSLLVDDVRHDVLFVISASDGCVRIFLSSGRCYFREVFSEVVPLRFESRCRTVRVVSSSEDDEGVCRLLVGGEDGSVFFLRLRLRYEGGNAVVACDLEDERQQEVAFLVDGVIVCADVMTFDDRRRKKWWIPRGEMMTNDRSLPPRRLVVVGSLDGFACLFEQQHPVKDSDADATAKGCFEGPLPVVEGLCTNAHRHSEDAVLAVHCFEFGTRAGYAIAVGTYSGRFIICEPVVLRSEMMTTTRDGDGGESDDKVGDDDVVREADEMEEEDEEDEKFVGTDGDMVTLESTPSSLLSDGNNDDDGDDDGGGKTDETTEEDNNITEDTNETDEDNTMRLDSTTLVSLPEGGGDDENDDDENDETNDDSEIIGETGILESSPALPFSDVNSDGDANSNNSDGEEGNDNGNADRNSDGDGDANSKCDACGDGDGDINTDGNSNADINPEVGNNDNDDADIKGDGDGDGEVNSEGCEDDVNSNDNVDGDGDDDRHNGVDDTNQDKDTNTTTDDDDDSDDSTYANDHRRYRRLWHCRLPYPIHAISSADLNGDGMPELLVTTRKSVHVFGANVLDLADVAKERFRDLFVAGLSSCGS